MTVPDLTSAVNSLALRDQGSRRGVTPAQLKKATQAAVASGFRLVPVSPTLVAGNAGPITTEGSYISVNAGVPKGAACVELLLTVNSTDNADDGDLRVMGSEGIDSGILVECVAGASDARDSVIKWVNLDAGGNFQVMFTNTSGGTIDWSVTVLGYSMG